MKLLRISGFCLLVSQGLAATPPVPEIDATAYYLLEANTGKVMAEKNIDQTVEPASITKIMTAYVTFAKIKDGSIKLEELADISSEAATKGGSKMFIKVGSQVKVEDLLRGMIVSSGNDASIAIAEHIAGSEDAFSDVMNEYALKLGMNNSYFTNATGWPEDGHYSSARDIAILSGALIRDFPKLYKIFAEKSFTYGKSPQGKDITQANRNGLLWKKGFKADGVKTGHTEAAGYCLAASATRGDMRLISVVMGSKSKKARINYSVNLLNYGFRHFRSKKIFAKDALITKAKIWKGEVDEIALGTDKDLYATVPRIKLNQLTSEIVVNRNITAPIVKGQKLGLIRAKTKDETVAEYPLLALEDVVEAGIFGRLWDSALMFFLSWF